MRLRHLAPIQLLLLPSLVVAIDDCANILAGGYSFDLHKLRGPHSVTATIDKTPQSYTNLTVILDICAPLKKGVKKNNECPNGTMVCGIEHMINPADNTDTVTRVIPIAGDFPHDGRHIEAHWTRLRTSSSHSDSTKEGVRGEFHGGLYVGDKRSAIIEFICDHERTGLEGADPPKEKGGNQEEDRKEDAQSVNRRKNDKDENQDPSSSLQFISYDPKEKGSKDYVLRLEWKTQYACEKDGGSSSGHWGFFTWFIIIIFLATATYLIFGSWLNYNRYGARGWDLLPHGDTIRDLPYLMRDWTRRVVSTVQGGGSRGGYSAV